MTTMVNFLTMDSIREVVGPLTPIATVYLGVPIGTASLDAEGDLALRRRTIGARLTDLGAPPATVETVERCVTSLPAYPVEAVIAVRGTDVVVCQPAPGVVSADRVDYAAPGDVVAMLSWLQRHPPYVEILIDRTGADVTTVPGGARPSALRRVDGPDDEIERNAPGGWSQPRFRRRAEDSWRHNAAAVADVAIEELHRAGTELLLLGGDVRAVQLLHERLPARVVVKPIPGGRHPDGSRPARTNAITNQRRSYVDEAAGVALAELDSERGPRGRAVEGVTNTIAALAAGRVRTLLVGDDRSDDRTAWFGPEILCVDESTVTGAGGDTTLRPGRLVDVAIRAAVLTDAEIRVLSPGQAAQIAESIGALCRFPA